jgi:hypothetical protein
MTAARGKEPLCQKHSPASVFDWRQHLKIHPAADLFPLMSESELKELAEDIKKNGLKNPIVLVQSELRDESGKLTRVYTHALLEYRRDFSSIRSAGNGLSETTRVSSARDALMARLQKPSKS